MLNKVKTIFWYLKQPKGVALVFNLFKRATFYKNLENTQQESVKWCESRAVSTEVAIQNIFPGNNLDVKKLENLFPQQLEYGRNKVQTTPFSMGGGGDINLLFNVCELTKAKYVLETGVAYGWSSLAILLSISKIQNSKLFSTDMPYAKMGNDNFVGVVVPEELRTYWTLIRESDLSGLPKALSMADSLDVVHYDSDKSYIGRMKSYPLLYNKLRKGGVFISDDIQDNIAFKHFCERLNIDPVVVSFEGKFVGVFVK